MKALTFCLLAVLAFATVPALAEERTGRSDTGGESATGDGGHGGGGFYADHYDGWDGTFNNEDDDPTNNYPTDANGDPIEHVCCKDAPGDYDGDGDIDAADESHFLW